MPTRPTFGRTSIAWAARCITCSRVSRLWRRLGARQGDGPRGARAKTAGRASQRHSAWAGGGAAANDGQGSGRAVSDAGSTGPVVGTVCSSAFRRSRPDKAGTTNPLETHDRHRRRAFAWFFGNSGGVIVVATDRGILQIQSDVDDVQVVVTSGGQEVATIDAKTGSQIRWLPTGEYQIKLVGDDNDIKLDKSGFQMTRLGRVIVTARWNIEAGVNVFDSFEPTDQPITQDGVAPEDGAGRSRPPAIAACGCLKSHRRRCPKGRSSIARSSRRRTSRGRPTWKCGSASQAWASTSPRDSTKCSPAPTAGRSARFRSSSRKANNPI